MARVVAIIPARLGSRRFPRKALHPIDGQPLIYHPWKAAGKARLVDRLFVATDSVEIGRAVTGFGGTVLLTSSRPRNGTERVAEAMADLRADLIVNIQGDNLGLTGAVLDRVIAAMLADKTIPVATLARKINGRDWKQKLYDPNVVKVVVNDASDACWFSRYPIPYLKHRPAGRAVDAYPFLEHIGVYFFRRKALAEYIAWPRGRAEAAESLEQLRILENGRTLRVFLTRCPVVTVDSKDALAT